MLKSLRSGEAAMKFIMLAVLIDMVAIGVIIPVLPALVGSFSRSRDTRSMTRSTIFSVIVTACWASGCWISSSTKSSSSSSSTSEALSGWESLEPSR